MRKAVYLIDQPLDERNYERFGIEFWLQRGWSVEVWDLTPWAQPTAWRSFIELGNKTRDFAGHFSFDCARQLTQRLADAGRIDYFIDLTSNSYQSLRAKLALQRAGAVRIVCAVGSIPVPDREPLGPLAKLRQILAKGPGGAFKWLSSAFIQRVLAPHIETGLAVVSGEQSIEGVRDCGAIVRAHNFDYDNYLSLLKSTPRSAGALAVFIDQDYCFHPEYLYQSIRPIVTPERYCPAVRHGLELIAAALNMEVRIAAHPRASYQRRGVNCFGSFPLEYGKTAELIQDSAAVVCHDSTALQFAVLFEKPIIIVTTDQLNLAYEGRSIAKVAAELGKTPINLDRADLHAVNWAQEMRVDRIRYAAYRNRYVKTGASPEMPLWDIVLNHIEISDSKVA